MKRRRFIRKAIESLGYMSIGLVAMFTGGKTGLPYISQEDMPPMPPVKPPRPDDEEKVSDVLFDTVRRGKATFTEMAHWHHVVYINWEDEKERLYLDGKSIPLDSLSLGDNYEIERYKLIVEQGNVDYEAFWFRRNRNDA